MLMFGMMKLQKILVLGQEMKFHLLERIRMDIMHILYPSIQQSMIELFSQMVMETKLLI